MFSIIQQETTTTTTHIFEYIGYIFFLLCTVLILISVVLFLQDVLTEQSLVLHRVCWNRWVYMFGYNTLSSCPGLEVPRLCYPPKFWVGNSQWTCSILSKCVCLFLSCWHSPVSFWEATCTHMRHENTDTHTHSSALLTTLSSLTAETHIPVQRRGKEGPGTDGDWKNKWMRRKKARSERERSAKMPCVKI